MKIKNKFFLAAITGALAPLAFAPFHFFVAAIISLSFFFNFLEKKADTTKQAALLGFCYGFGYFVTGIYWIAISLLVDAQKFAWLIPFALTLLPAFLALYFSAFAALYKKITNHFQRLEIYQKIILFATLWLVFEMLRSVLFTGFPWNLLGYGLMFSDSLSQLAAIFGIYGLTFFAVLFCLIPTALLSSGRGNKIFSIAILLSLFIAFFYGNYRLQKAPIAENESVKLRLVQGNIKQTLKWDPVEKYHNFAKHIDLSNASPINDIAAVIWSETSVPYAIGEDEKLLQELKKATPPNGVLITGALRLQRDEAKVKVWNSVFTLNQNGVANYYDKHHLVPFGEYIPFAKYLPFVEKITGGDGEGFGEGEGAQTLEGQGFSYSPLICYEIIFADEVVNKNHRPDLLVNVTNDAWFGFSTGPFQHFDMAKMRAIEQGIPLARAANTGITAFVDPLGRVESSIALNETGFIDVNLINKLDPTIFSRFNYWPLAFVVLAMVLLIL